MTFVTQESNDIRTHLARSMPGSLVSLLGNGEFCIGYTEDRFGSAIDIMSKYITEAVKGYFGKDCAITTSQRGYGSKVVLDYTRNQNGIPRLDSPQRKVVINVQGLSGTVRIEEGTR